MLYDENRRHALALADTPDLEAPPLPIRQAPAQQGRTLTEKEAAGFLGLTQDSLADRRKRGTGPTVANKQGPARYRMEDLCAWAEATPPSRYKPGKITLPAFW